MQGVLRPLAPPPLFTSQPHHSVLFSNVPLFAGSLFPLECSLSYFFSQLISTYLPGFSSDHLFQNDHLIYTLTYAIILGWVPFLWGPLVPKVNMNLGNYYTLQLSYSSPPFLHPCLPSFSFPPYYIIGFYRLETKSFEFYLLAQI